MKQRFLYFSLILLLLILPAIQSHAQWKITGGFTKDTPNIHSAGAGYWSYDQDQTDPGRGVTVFYFSKTALLSVDIAPHGGVRNIHLNPHLYLSACISPKDGADFQATVYPLIGVTGLTDTNPAVDYGVAMTLAYRKRIGAALLLRYTRHTAAAGLAVSF